MSMLNGQVPFLPGNSFGDPSLREHAKKHFFDFRNGIPVEDLTKNAAPELIDVGDAGDEFFQPSKRVEVDEFVPAFVALDRKVLRFYAFFRETVHERPDESSRVRQCVIYYYLEDDSVHVAEPKQENSGIPQGVFIKRHRVPDVDGDPGANHHWSGYNIGNEVTFYGRAFRIVDCDDFTREFFDSQGVELNPAESYPEDPYTELRKTMVEGDKPSGPPKPKDDDLVRFNEAKLGLASNLLSEDKLKKFLFNDRKVLRFYASWDDTERLFGERRPFVLHYFLSDDTVEILESIQNNNGRDPFPAFLKRQRLPKKSDGLFETVQTLYNSEINLRVGDFINVFGRKFLLKGCDAFTRRFYKTVHGIEQGTLDEAVESFEKMQIQVPPYNGYGSEEDSLNSFLYLIPKVPKKEFKKLMANDRKVLRFAAVLRTTVEEENAERPLTPYTQAHREKVAELNAIRRFILAYYLADDTISMFEPPQHNTGIASGKFLERRRIKKPRGEDGHYTVDDLKVGAVLEIFSHKFEITDCDLYTGRYLGDYTLTDEKFQDLLKKLRDAFSGDSASILDVFKAVDTDSSGSVDALEFKEVLHRVGIDVNSEELKMLVASYDRDGNGSIDYREFTSKVTSEQAAA